MNLAISNIAWPAGLDAAAYALLATHGIAALEIAPTRVWPNWEGITPASLHQFKALANDAGLRISSLQSLCFQKPGLRLFGVATDRIAMYDHLRGCADIAAELGAGALVFGSPKNRDRGALPEADALSLAVDFFSDAAAAFAQRNVSLVLEPNPIAYGCNFATESRTAARIVEAVDSPGLRLHLDTACLHLAGEAACAVIETHSRILRHFHVSEPHLGSFDAPTLSHPEIAAALNRAGYPHWVALEMRAADPPLPALERAARFLRSAYGQCD